MKPNYFTSGAWQGNALARFAMSNDPVQLLESVRKKEQEPPEPPAPAEPPAPPADPVPPEPVPPSPPSDPLLESRGKDMELEDVHVLILESAKRAAAQNDLSSAAEVVFAWAGGESPTYDDLDGYAQANAGISDDDDEVTEEQEAAYNIAWGNIANFLAACGIDDELIEALADDEDDDAAEEVAALLSGLDAEDRDEIEAAFVVAGSDGAMLTEAFKKVVRHGEVVLIKKRLRKKRLTAAQKSALKKARRKANTGMAKLARKKSIKIRRKRLG